MISLYGPGFIGRNFYHMYEPEVEIVNKDDRKPKSDDILYTISTVDNYNVHDNITLDVDTNLHVLCEVLDHCRSEDITFNFLSSWFVYGKGITPASETTSCNPQGFYSITKLCAENLIRSFAQTTGMKYRILRLCNVMGPGDRKANRKKNAIQWMINELKADRDVKMYDNGSHCRDIMHVDDVCRAIKLVMDAGNYNETYNIGSGKPTQIKKVIKQTVNSIGSGKPLFGKIKYKKDTNMKLYPDVTSAKKILKWKSYLRFKRGLNLTINSYR